MEHKEAIKIVKKNYPHVGFSGSQFETALRVLVPELAESEDERIRKIIIKYFRGSIGLGVAIDGVSVKDIVAYLEKQKEQKPVKLDDDTEIGLDRALQIVKAANGNLRGYQSDDGIYECCHAIQTLERILKNGIEQKPAEQLSGTFTSYDMAKTFTEGQNYVIAHPEKFGLCKPAEWSEEDEKMSRNVYESLYAYQCDIRAGIMDKNSRELLDDVEKEKQWLKSLRPQPRWKPSEEQMKALEEVRTIFHHHHLWDEINPILYDYEELMRDLQKL